MACSMNMFSVIKMRGPKGPIPAGMKVTALAGPNTFHNAPECPVLAVGGFTLWPLSYIDNRVSFGMVMYNPKWKVVNILEKTSARYVYKITLHQSAKTVTFSGQADKSVTMSVDDICRMLISH